MLYGPLLQPVVAMLSDPVEKCRECAVHFLAKATCSIPDVAPLLPSLMPAVAKRMGHPPVLETAEEVRLSLVHLVAGPLMERAGKSLAGELFLQSQKLKSPILMPEE